MRMNRGTILLLLISLVVIAVVVFLTINQATAPGDEEVVTGQESDAEATEVALFPGIDSASILRLEVRDNTTGERTVLLKQDDATWGMGDADGVGAEQALTGVVEEATAEPVEVQSSSFDIDEAQVQTLLDDLLTLRTTERFEAEDIAQFGLDAPAYSVFAVADSGEVYVLYVGDRNPSGTRYYGVIEQIAPGDTSPNLPDMDVDLDRPDVDTSQDGVIVPEQEAPAQAANDAQLLAVQETLQAMATDDPRATELAATYQAMIEARNEVAGTATAVGSDEAEATAQAGEGRAVAQNATPAAASTVEETPRAVAPDVERADVETSLSTDEAEPPVAPTSAVPADSSAMEVTVEAAEAPAVRLEGPQIIYLLPQTPINALIAVITAPPLAEATATAGPTLDAVPTEMRSSSGLPMSTEPVDATAEATAE